MIERQGEAIIIRPVRVLLTNVAEAVQAGNSRSPRRFPSAGRFHLALAEGISGGKAAGTRLATASGCDCSWHQPRGIKCPIGLPQELFDAIAGHAQTLEQP